MTKNGAKFSAFIKSLCCGRLHKREEALTLIKSLYSVYHYDSELVIARQVAWKKLRPRSMNEFTITDTFDLVDEVRNLSFNKDDVTALFSNEPLDEAISILVNKAFTREWLLQ